MEEIFAKPCVGAIIEKEINGEKYILVQTRKRKTAVRQTACLKYQRGKLESMKMFLILCDEKFGKKRDLL